MDPFLQRVRETRELEKAKALLFETLEQVDEKTVEALAFAESAHEGQYRKSGEPYIVHPVLVAAITAWIGNDNTMVQAALLHDTVEDTDVTLEEIVQRFGDDVAHLVSGMTKIVAIRDEELAPSGSDERLIGSALSFRKMLIASVKDVRVLLIKLCDRLHNMLTLDALSAQKQRRIAEETLVVYAPIAHRLGIAKIKNQLEDLAFYYIYPDDYAKIDSYLERHAQDLQLKLNAFISKIKQKMLQNGFDEKHFEIFGRVKHRYSIYLKMHRKGIGIDEVLDLLAVRIIVGDPLACYKVLGILHTGFTPLIARFKDYIAIPKENGYRTIHTTLFDESGILEAQIRTFYMHRLAEYGIAAHWKYKEGDAAINLGWLEALSYQEDSAEEFYELAKSDLFSEEITIFSPKGDYYTLPKDSTALDFAYAVHSAIGDSAVGAYVNKEKASLLTVLKNGDIVRIERADKPVLHCSWESAVKTSKAKSAIRSACRAHLREIDRDSAIAILSTLFAQEPETMQVLITRAGLEDELYRCATQVEWLKAAIKRIAALLDSEKTSLWERLKKGFKKPKFKEIEQFRFFTNRPVGGVEFDYCCHPKAGDRIVAFYKDTKAIIHHKLCKHAEEGIKAHEAMLFVEWKNPKLARYRLLIGLQNQKGILAELLRRLSDLQLNVLSIELGIKTGEEAEYCRIEVESPLYKKSQLARKISTRFKLVEIVSLDDAYNN